MNRDFQAAYKQLNTAQRQAVDAIDGPVLVVAGPGTGKTQLLSLCVANILQQTDSDPGSILCLTFTNFAATNMRDRLTKLVGAGAHQVVVRTFHSFAAEIMNLYPDYFWNGARLSIAPDAVQLEIIQNILTELPLDNPLAVKFAGNFTMIHDVQQAIRLAKEAGLTPEKLAAMLAVNESYIDILEPQLVEILASPLSIKKLDSLQTAIEQLPDQPIDASVAPLASLSTVLKTGLVAAIAEDQASGKTTQTGAWKRRWLQSLDGQKGMFDERRRNSWWQAIVAAYESYRDHLHQHGYYDYSDMLVEVITQLEQHPELLASVQERFLYVLIDEFQDTNAAQLRLAHLVAAHTSTEGKPNLMAVGDDDQSIFAFNGAELNNMLTFQRTYPTTKTIVLQKNYRSSQAILDTARTIIEQAEDRLVKRRPDLVKNLQSTIKTPAGRIEHLAYPTREHQLSAIAKHIQQSWEQKPAQDLAVLARNHDSLRRLSSMLVKLGVPIRYEQQNNVLEQEFVVQICLLAELVIAIGEGDERAVSSYLSQLLPHPAWGVSSEQLWKLALTNRQEPQWLESLLGHSDKQLAALGHWLQWLAQMAGHEPLPVMMEYLLGLRGSDDMTSPLRDYFIALGPITNRYLEGLSALQVLRNLVTEFASGQTQATLADFVRFIRLNRELGRPVTDESWFMSGERAVQLMTIHKAKGLEFDTVFLIDAIEDNWRPRHSSRKPPANLPLQPYGEHYDDYVRLLYVAATRARHSFIISSYYTDGQGRPVLATPLITSNLPAIVTSTGTIEEAINVLEAGLTWPRLETTNERALLTTKLDNYHLSSTAYIQFLDVTTGGPQHFLEEQLLRLPNVVTANMAYGTAIHQALQAAQQLTNSGRFSLAAVLRHYEKALQAKQLPAVDFARYAPHGKQILTSLFKEKDFSLTKGSQAEFALSNIRLDNVRLSGNLDRVDTSDQQLIITDYKTGKPLGSFTTRDQAKAVKVWRHRTQLTFYALLARASGRFPKDVSIETQVVYVEADKPRELTLRFSPDQTELDRLQRLIDIVWQHIMELNLTDISQYAPDHTGISAFEDDLLSGRI